MSVSASGARIQGDDYQHLLAWHHALLLAIPESSVERVGVESFSAGNVDDVVIRRRVGSDEYIQVKYSVDANNPITSEWFLTPQTSGGKSPLQRFAASWELLRGKKAATDTPTMTLFTNRVLDPSDPILSLRDGQRATLATRLRQQTPNSAASKQLRQWAKHVGQTKEQLLELLSRLALKTDRGAYSELVEATSDRMGFAGLQRSALDVEAGLAAIRGWVKDGVREIDKSLFMAEVVRRKLQGDKRYGTLLVEAIDHAPWPESAQARLNWVDLFQGNEPRARRQLKDPAQWISKLRPEMTAAARTLEATGARRVVVRGYMRLPLWFLAGTEFPDTRGHHVAATQRGDFWTSESQASKFEVATTTTPLGQGEDLAVGLSVTNPVDADVIAHCKQAKLPVSALVAVSPLGGAGPKAIMDGESALGWALATRDAIRAAVRESGARRVHLFMSGPAAGALMLGHVWNRVAPTLVYEDLCPGYAPTFEIPS
jgi:hypothetical protein